MTDTNKPEQNAQPDGERYVKQFPVAEQEQVRSIWQDSRRARPERQEITDESVEQALESVHERLYAGQERPQRDSRTRNTGWSWGRIAAAASVLLVLGAGLFYLFVPVSVEVPHGETASLVLPDGSQVELNSGSELQYGRLYDLYDRRVSLNGEAYFAVQPGELPFEVAANGSRVRVTGTEFNVRSWKQDPRSETEVAVSEGRVLFYPENRSGRAVTIGPGQLSSWAVGFEAPTSPDSVSLDRALGWMDRKFAFSKKPLAVILRELERRFDTRIRLEAEGYRDEEVTIFYVNPKDVEVILKDVCRVKGLRYSPTTEGFRVYR